MGRTPCCDKTKVKRGPWSPEEDSILKNYLHSHGTGGNWIALPGKAGLKRCGKSCRLRWLNYLRPDIKHGGFTDEEDNIILDLYLKIGSRWSVIASNLQGRTDNDVKNYWNTKMKKKLAAAQGTNWNNVSGNNRNNNEFQRIISPKVEEADHEYENNDYPIMNSTTLIPNSTELMSFKEQEVSGSSHFSILSSWLMEDEEEEGTSTAINRSVNMVSSSNSQETTPTLSPSISPENSDYASWYGVEMAGELGFLNGFDFQEEMSAVGIDHHQAYNSSYSSLFSRNDAPELGWYQSVIN